MKRISIAALLISLIVVLFIVIANWQNSRVTYKPVDFFTSDQQIREYFVSDSEISLLKNVIAYAGGEGQFNGFIKQERSPEKIIIIIRNEYVPDDSLGTVEFKFIARKDSGKWVVTELLRRNSCQASRFDTWWEKILSSFIDPVWTRSHCI